MQEAKFSWNVKANIAGFDCQFTVREDLLPQFRAAIKATQELIAGMGALPERRWENGKSQAPVPVQDEFDKLSSAAPGVGVQTNGKSQGTGTPVCPEHGKSAQSRFGGLYCPSKMPDGSFCDWRDQG